MTKKAKKVEETMNWIWIIAGLTFLVWKLEYGLTWVFSAFLYRGKL